MTFKYPMLLEKTIAELYDFHARKAIYGLKDTDKYIARDFDGNIKTEKLYLAYLGKTIPLPDSKAFVGVEVEIEQAPGEFLHSAWKEDKDGSLRNGGKEYISYVLFPQMVNKQIAALFAGIQTGNNDSQFTWRTSIHIHLCVRDRTIEEVLKLFLLYFTFERILFLYAGKDRENSVFCVPITRSSLAEDISEFFSQSGSIARLVDNWHKYSALNLTRINDYGTIEFRHLPGTWDVAKISGWIGILLSLYNSAIEMPIDKIVNEIKTLNTTSKYMMFRDEVFGPKFGQLLAIPNFDLVSEGVSFAKECLSGISPLQITEQSSMMKYIRREASKKKEQLSKKIEIRLGNRPISQKGEKLFNYVEISKIMNAVPLDPLIIRNQQYEEAMQRAEEELIKAEDFKIEGPEVPF